MSCRQSEPVALCDVSLLITQTFFHFIYLVFLHVAKWKSADIKVGRHCPSSGRSRSLKYLWARLPKRPWHPFMLTWHQQPLRHGDANPQRCARASLHKALRCITLIFCRIWRLHFDKHLDAPCRLNVQVKVSLESSSSSGLMFQQASCCYTWSC